MEIRDNYERTWIAMADNNASIYEDIKRLEIYEYWALFDSWRKRKEAEAQHYKQQQTKKHGR